MFVIGLDSSKYNRTVVPTTTDDNNYFAPSTELDAEEKFKNVDKFTVECRLCGQVETFPGIPKNKIRGEWVLFSNIATGIFRDFAKKQSGLSCKCGESYTSGLLQNQLGILSLF